MNVLIPLLAGLLLLGLGARFYSSWISRLLGVDDRRPTPARRLEDGRDYVPTRTHVVFAHHFATIAGAGPIVGPTLALAFGWAPAWGWIVLGCILFGAVHDMTAMFISLREDGRSLADVCRRTLGGAGYFCFLAFLLLILTLINAIFLKLSCKALSAAYPAALLKLEPGSRLIGTFVQDGVVMGRIGGIATTSVFVITLFAPLVGWLAHRRRLPGPWLYLLSAGICAASIALGFRFPIALTPGTWLYVMSAYVFLACWVPVWLVMQPRDFVNVQILYAGVLLLAAGLVWLGFTGRPLAAAGWAVAEGTRLAGGPVWPFLMITVACGAISGFHSLAAGGTTAKQVTSESAVRRVGYYAMVLEGALALMALLLVAAVLPRGEYLAIVFPAGGEGNPILAFAVAVGYLLHDMLGLPVAAGCVAGILVLEGFVVTTLDTAVRLCRYILEEFWGFLWNGRAPAFFRNAFVNTGFAVGLMLLFATSSTLFAAWKVFGAGNQLIAALAMTVASFWLLARGRAYWFALAPALFMTVTTFAMLLRQLWSYHAAAPAGALVAAKDLPLAVASLLLLALATGVILVSLRRLAGGRWRVAAALAPAVAPADSPAE
ncbi:MAG: carbon starvation CstA family protein [Lentisphaeria bacterium]